MFEKLTGKVLVADPEAEKVLVSMNVDAPVSNERAANALAKSIRALGFRLVMDEKEPRIVRWEVEDEELVAENIKAAEEKRKKSPPRRTRYIPRERD